MKFKLQLPWWHRLLRPFFELRALYKDYQEARRWQIVGYLIFGTARARRAVTLACQRNGLGKRRVVFHSGIARIDLLGHSPFDDYVFHRCDYPSSHSTRDWVLVIKSDAHIRAWADGDDMALDGRLWSELPPPDWDGWTPPQRKTRSAKSSR